LSASAPDASAVARQIVALTRFPPAAAYRSDSCSAPSSGVSARSATYASASARSSSGLRIRLRLCAPLGLAHRTLDLLRDLGRHALRLELLDADPEDVPFDRAEPVGGPALGRLRDRPVELRRPLRDGLGKLARERVDVALVERRERLAGEVPLVEEKERG